MRYFRYRNLPEYSCLPVHYAFYNNIVMRYGSVFVWIFSICFNAHLSMGQKTFGRYALGIETSFDFAQYQAGAIPSLIPALLVDVSVGRWGVGGGVGREFYRPYEYYTWTGAIVERIEEGRPVPYYVSTLRAFRPAYWTFPLRMQYRLHRCECVFLHAGMAFDVFSSATAERIVFEGAELRQAPFQQVRRDQLFYARTRSYEFGIGFNLLSRDFFRLTARPSVVVSEDPEIYTTGPGRVTTARMTFGVQWGFVRR